MARSESIQTARRAQARKQLEAFTADPLVHGLLKYRPVDLSLAQWVLLITAAVDHFELD